MADIKSKEEIFNTIVDVLEKDFECPREKMVPDAQLFQDLDLDSIDAIDLIVKLQNIADIKVSPNDFKQIRTLGDVAEVTHNILKEQQK